MVVFDYIFFRMTEWSIRKGETLAAWMRGLCAVAGLQYFILFIVFVVYHIVARENLSHLFRQHPQSSRVVVVVLMAFLFFLNYLRYVKHNKYEFLFLRWGDESPRLRTRNKWLLILIGGTVAALPIILGFIFFRDKSAFNIP